MVGEPVTYATGSPELKVMGPTKRGLPLPDQGQERCLRGRTANKPPLAQEPAIAEDARNHARRAYRIISVSVWIG